MLGQLLFAYYLKILNLLFKSLTNIQPEGGFFSMPQVMIGPLLNQFLVPKREGMIQQVICTGPN